MEQESKPQEVVAKKFFIKRLTNGELGLYKTFWFYAFGGPILVNIAYFLLSKFVWGVWGYYMFPIAYFIYSLCMIPILVGVWKAANIYKKQKGDKPWGADLAKIYVVLEALNILAGLGSV